MLAQGYFKGQRSRIFTNCIFLMTLSDMQSSSGNYSMRHQVPVVSLLLLVYLSAVAYISVEIRLGSCWCRDILRVKGQGLITNCKLYNAKMLLKGLSVIFHSKRQFFPIFFFFCIFRENPTKLTYLYNNSLRNRIFFWKERQLVRILERGVTIVQE